VTFVIIFILLIIALFGIAFMTKRRFGVLGLALAAGSMLATLWVGDLTPLIAQAGFILVRPPLESVVAALLTLLPAILLLTSGPSYHSARQRVVGALLFATLATVLMLDALGSALVIEGVGKLVFDFLVTNRVVIITVCLTVAIFDLLAAKTPKIPSKH
jgi:hypothetical protein